MKIPHKYSQLIYIALYHNRMYSFVISREIIILFYHHIQKECIFSHINVTIM